MENIDTAPDQDTQPTPTTPSETPQPPIDLEQESPQVTRWPVVLATVVGVLILSAAGYLVYQKYQLGDEPEQSVPQTSTPDTEEPADETAGWETYRNTDYGITFKYPAGYKVRDQERLTVEDFSLYIFDREPYLGNTPDPFIGISLYQDAGLDLESWLERHTTTKEVLGPDEDRYFDQVVDVGPCSVAGLQNCKQFYSGLRRGAKNYVFERAGRIYSIKLKTYEELYGSGSAIEEHFDLILPTFKFTGAVVDETADWKTFSSDSYKYTFKYPPSWEEKPAGEGCGPVFAPVKAGEFSVVGSYWLTVCGPHVNPEDTPEQLAQGAAANSTEISRTELLVGGREAIRQVIYRDKNVSEINVYVDRGPTALPTVFGGEEFPICTVGIHFYNRTDQSITTYESQFDQILSTFKFTE